MKGKKASVAAQAKKAAIIASARLPTRFGKFTVFAFSTSDKLEHVAIVKGSVRGAVRVPVRLHSECLTGDVFFSLRCDCRAQLEAALCGISRLRRGAVLYMRQEGRGIGLANKIRAYELQDRGFDTVQANLELGFPSDMRDYRTAAEMVKALGIKSVLLITNNPDKMSKLVSYGIKVAGRIPDEPGATVHNLRYLQTKKKKMAHMLSDV